MLWKKCFLVILLLIPSQAVPVMHAKETIGVDVRTFTYKKIEGLEIKADAYFPPKAKNLPAVVYVHGGGLIFGSRKSLWEPLRDALVEAGYAFVSIDFRLAPETKAEEIIGDVADACRWIRSEGAKRYSLDPKRTALIGGSSGGYLALVAGQHLKPKPRAVVSVSGLGDLGLLRKNHNPDRSGLTRTEGPYTVVNSSPVSGSEDPRRLEMGQYLMENGWLLFETLGFDPDEDLERYDRLSFLKNIPADYPPTLIVHAEKDPNVPFKEAEKILSALKSRDIECKLCSVKEGHSSGIIEKYPEVRERIVSFLDKHLK